MKKRLLNERLNNLSYVISYPIPSQHQSENGDHGEILQAALVQVGLLKAMGLRV